MSAKTRFLVVTMAVAMGLVVGCDGNVTPDAVDSEAMDPGVMDPGAMDSEAEEPDAEEPEAEDPDAEEPEAEDPDAEDPDAEDPDAEDPDAEDPDAEDPDAEDPDAADPDQEAAVIGLEVTASVEGVALDDGEGTTSSVITVEGVVQDESNVAEFSYSWNGAEFEPIVVDSDAFAFELTLVGSENSLVVRAIDTTDATERISVQRTYFRAIAAKAGTHDRQCLGNGTAERCEELCEDYGGEYDADWGHIGGCRNMPNASSGDGLDFNEPGRVPPARNTTHDQQCLGSTSAAHAAACEEICTDIGGTYDADWGNIGGCRDIPGSGLADLDFGDGTIRPAPVARDTTHDQQCLGSTSPANAAACEEICTDIGGTYDADWGNIGGCRDIPGAAGADLDFTHPTPRRRVDR